jgi:hypothetical protein
LKIPKRVDPFFVIVLALATLYWAFALSPSSYALVLHRFGVEDTGLVAGTPRPIRADEYAIFTPQVQIALRNHLGRYNETSPYREDLRTPYSLPLLDWGLAFKPAFWPFAVASPAYAYSFYFVFYAVAFLIGYALLFRRLGFPGSWSSLASTLLFFSGFVQLWWTSLGPHAALLPWILIVFMARLRAPLRLALLAYLFCVWLLSAQFYPPYVLSLGLAGAAALMAFRPECMTRGRIITVVAAAAIACTVAVAYLDPALSRLIHSQNHGQRMLAGGAVPLAAWLGQFWPLFALHGLESWTPSNACESSSVGSYLVLLIVCLIDVPATRAAFAARADTAAYLRIALWLGAPFLLMSIWMLVRLPWLVGAPLLWHLMPGSRLLFAAGLLMLLLALATLQRARLRVSAPRLALVVLAVTAGWAIKYALRSEGFADAALDDLYVLMPALLVLPFVGSALRTWVLAVAAAANVVSFGGVNPLQSSQPIFAHHDTPLLAQLFEEQQAHPRGWLVRGGFPGSVLNGMGLSAVNHMLILPEVDFFREFFPELPEDELQSIFNRYGMISPARRVPLEGGGYSAPLRRPRPMMTAVWVPERPFRSGPQLKRRARSKEPATRPLGR